MPLITLDKVSVAFGLNPLLEAVDLQIEPGERVCLIGRNGCGKSTLLKLIDHQLQPDSGSLWHRPGLRLARLSQELPEDEQATVFQTVVGGLDTLGQLVNDYHEAVVQLATVSSPEQLRRVERLQQALEARDGWRLNQRVESVLTRLSLPAEQRLGELSGGWRRRVALARALVCDPELLLLDEPTNHLDLEAIQWLEEQLLEYRGGLLFVTHDRAMLDRLATRIVELDRGVLTSWPGDYQRFLDKKAATLEVEERHNAKFDKLLSREEAWIRQGIKARRTRNQGRVKTLKALREERRQRRQQPGRPGFGVEQGESSGQLVIEAQKIDYTWQDTPLIRDYSVRILRGDRIGLIGPNGSGKTTLLNILLGRLPPDKGRVRLGSRLQVAYFDQLRSQLELEKSVIDNVAEGREFIHIDGRNRHIISYLGDFLFTPERVRTPVKALSGGERNRLLLARLFSQPANLLVLDEPTNDLDIETLELLEELLMTYRNTLLLVSHDRAFLDNVVTSCLVFEGQGRVQEYVGGYSDWLRQRRSVEVARTKVAKPVASDRSRGTQAKLSYKDRRELEQLPQRIEQLETEQSELQQLSADPALYREQPEQATQVLKRLQRLEQELETAYARWEQLESGPG